MPTPTPIATRSLDCCRGLDIGVFWLVVRFALAEQTTVFEGLALEVFGVTLGAEVFVAETFDWVAGLKKPPNPPRDPGSNSVVLQHPTSSSAAPSWAPQHQSPAAEPFFQAQWYTLLKL